MEALSYIEVLFWLCVGEEVARFGGFFKAPRKLRCRHCDDYKLSHRTPAWRCRSPCLRN